MKTVIFDFDGTLSVKGANVWKNIWSGVGYSTSKGSLFSKLYVDFINGKFSHGDWCDKTCAALKVAGLNKKLVENVANEIIMQNGIEETLNELKSNNISLHILSGGVKEVIENKLGKNIKLFDSINANEFIYDNNNNICDIKETKFDYSGKEIFIKNLLKNKDMKPSDIIFVGNGDNDEWVKKSGCKTICINPDLTDSNDKSKWDYSIPNLNNLNEILPIIDHIFQSDYSM